MKHKVHSNFSNYEVKLHKKLIKKYKKYTTFSCNEIKAHFKLIKLLKNNIICPKCKNYVNVKTYEKFQFGENTTYLSWFKKEESLKGLFSCKCNHVSFNEFEKLLCLEFKISNKRIYIIYFPISKTYHIKIGVSPKIKFDDFESLIETLYSNNLADDMYSYNERFNLCQLKNRVNKLLSFLYKLEQNMLFL